MFLAPKDVVGPNLMQMFIDELGGYKSVARHLHVSEKSVRRWLETGRVPRAAVLALYWESKFGRSAMNTQLVNEIRLIYRQLCIVQEQYAKAKDMVAGLRKLHTGSSNEPVFEDLPQLDFMLRHSADNSKVSSHEFAATHSRRKVSGGK